MEERYTQIEYENRVLLKKMSKILSTNSMDNHVVHTGPKSLNSISRKKELKRIMNDNQKILHAIQSRKAVYNRNEWKTHAKNHESYLKNTRERPVRTLPIHNDEKRLGSAPSRKKITLDPIAGKKSGNSKRKKQDVEIFRGGKIVDEQYVVLTVKEQFTPLHALYFQTFDVDTSLSLECIVPFTIIHNVLGKTNPETR